jgi:hypothetical protein
MKSLRLLPIFLCLLFALSPTVAQETADTGWPIEERCLGEPTPPPDDWTFPGAILMTGHYGIHAVSANIATPYVVAFLRSNMEGVRREDTPNNNPLSPDGKWFVTLEGRYLNTTYESNAPYATGIIFISGIRVHSTGLIRESHFIPWDSRIDYRGALHPTPLPEAIWIDNETFALEGKVVNPFTKEISEIDNYYYNNVQGWDDGDYPSPDWTRHIRILDGMSWWGAGGSIYDVPQDEAINYNIEVLTGAVIEWKQDSSGFATEIPADGQAEAHEFLPPRLALFDRDGNQTDLIFDAQIMGEKALLSNGKRWSKDGRYLAFLAFTFMENDPSLRSLRLYIADTELHHIIDTCLSVNSSMAWSPNNDTLALMSDSGNPRSVIILDTQAWKLHTVSQHTLEYSSDGIIDWRGD